jgi:HPt (histidine-containing phosphotransfer) domain-containing protein
MIKGTIDDVSDLHEQLEMLGAEFSRGLSGRLAEIVTLCGRILSGPIDPADLEALHHRVHRLAGSGTTFGAPAISEAALKLEGSIRKVIAGERANPEMISEGLSALEAAIAARLAGEGKRPV